MVWNGWVKFDLTAPGACGAISGREREVQISRSLFVHHSFIIRSYSCIDFGSKKGSGGVSGGVPGLSWRVLGRSRGPLGGVLGRPGAISVKTFWL